ncbi:MAG TPA: glycosyltransferase family 4 protein [bacterium]|nr:glycosyltransferase family 4 protein [bacterium]
MTTDLGIGGAGRYLLNLLPGLMENGWDVAVACPGGGELEQELRQHGYRLHLLTNSDASWSRSVLGQMYRILKQEKYQIVHTHASFAGRVAARLVPGHRIVLTRHGLGAGKPLSWWRKLINHGASRVFTDKVIAISHAVAKSLINEGVPQVQITVIPNGIPAHDFACCSGAPVRMELGADHRPLIGMVARLVPEKEPQVFIKAAALIKKYYPEAMFILVGTGPLERELAELVSALGLGADCRLLGFRRDIGAITAALDVAVLTSRQEGQGLVLLEAMAAGKPIVATKVGGIIEMVHHERTGLLVPPGDTEALAEAVRRLLDNKNFADAMSRRGQEMVKREFSAVAMAQYTAALYRELLKG